MKARVARFLSEHRNGPLYPCQYRLPTICTRLLLYRERPHGSASQSLASIGVQLVSNVRSPDSVCPTGRLAVTRKLWTARPDGRNGYSGFAPTQPTNSSGFTGTIDSG